MNIIIMSEEKGVETFRLPDEVTEGEDIEEFLITGLNKDLSDIHWQVSEKEYVQIFSTTDLTNMTDKLLCNVEDFHYNQFKRAKKVREFMELD